MAQPAPDDFPTRILLHLLALRENEALPLPEIAPGRGIFRYRFRAAGWPVTVDLDTSVLEMRVYHGRDEVAMTRVTERLMDELLGRAKPAKKSGLTAEQALAALRQDIRDWKAGNPRIFVRPPVKIGHPDNWNGA
jgi:hypothetical protein